MTNYLLDYVGRFNILGLSQISVPFAIELYRRLKALEAAMAAENRAETDPDAATDADSAGHDFTFDVQVPDDFKTPSQTPRFFRKPSSPPSQAARHREAKRRTLCLDRMPDSAQPWGPAPEAPLIVQLLSRYE